jgi:malate dehydrogenase
MRLRDVRNVDGNAGSLGAHQHRVDGIEFFFDRRYFAGTDAKAGGVRPENAARALERAAQPFGRRLEHRPIEIALRRDDTPAATRYRRHFFFVFKGVRNRRKHIDRFLIRDREREPQFRHADDVAKKRRITDRVRPGGRSHADVDEIEVALALLTAHGCIIGQNRTEFLAHGANNRGVASFAGGSVNKRLRVAVSGAAGQIGYQLLFRIADGRMFGPDIELDLQLLELEQALGPLRGTLMELEDSAFPLVRSVQFGSDVDDAMRNADWAILVGAAPRKAGMERSDLLRINGAIFAEQGRAIDAHAADDVKIFVVGNPANTNCLIAMNNAPNVPRDRFFAMTTLDELRARAQLARKAGVAIGEISQMGIWGNHSTTQFPDFAHARISGKPAADVIGDLEWLQGEFIATVQNRGAQVIAARTASSAASAAHAAVVGVYNLTHDTPAGEYYSVGRCSNGEYGIDPGLIFSFPSRTENGVSRIVEGIRHDEFAARMVARTLDELRKERDAVKELGMIPA